jgi:hypothetical protein
LTHSQKLSEFPGKLDWIFNRAQGGVPYVLEYGLVAGQKICIFFAYLFVFVKKRKAYKQVVLVAEMFVFIPIGSLAFSATVAGCAFCALHLSFLVAICAVHIR